MYDTVIIEFELAAKHQLLFQAMLQGEDGLAMVRCINGVQQLWTTPSQLGALRDWLKIIPCSFNMRILDTYTWQRQT